MGVSAKKGIFFFSFLLHFSEMVHQNELRFFFCCIKCIKILLLSHTYQIFNKFSKFSPKAAEEVAMLTWTTIEWAKACKAIGGASHKGGLDKP